MKEAAGLLCGLAALREFKQIIRLSLLTDEHTHTHTQPSCGMLTVFISVQALGNKASSFSAPRPAAYSCLPNKHRHRLDRDVGPIAPSAGEPAELWLTGWCVTPCVYLLQSWLYLMWQWGWSIMAESRSQRDKYWDGLVPRDRFKTLWCTNQFVVKRAHYSEMCPPFHLCVAASLHRSVLRVLHFIFCEGEECLLIQQRKLSCRQTIRFLPLS